MLSFALFDRSKNDTDLYLFDDDMYHFKTLVLITPIYTLILFDRELNSLSNSINI